MATSAVVSLDSFGRIAIPKFLRDLLSSRRFVAKVEHNKLSLEPIDWESQRGSLPRSVMKRFIKQHEEECRD